MDTKLLLLINRQWTSSALDRFMATMSSFDVWTPILLVLAAVLLWRGNFHVRAAVLAAAATAGLMDGAISNPIKSAVNRPRPAQVMSGVRVVDLAKAKPRILAVFREPKVKISAPEDHKAGVKIEGRSFPSSHTANTIAAALVFSLFFPRRGWVAVLPALAVAYSRIYTGAHWPSDVLGSLLLGSGVALLAVTALELAWRRYGATLAPRLHVGHPSLLSA